MRFTITHHGVPVGTVEMNHAVISASEHILRVMAPLPGYASIQPIVRGASDALRRFLPAGPLADLRTELAAQRALARGTELGHALELCGPTGVLLPTDFIELIEWPGRNSPVAALLRFRRSQAAFLARLPARGSSSGAAAAPAA